MDPWMELVTRGRITDYTDEPGDGAVEPLPADVPCTDPLAQACQNLGIPVYPVFEANSEVGK